ncbi:MAG TPA: hypothetical protein VFJ67_10065 [Thermodesulfobacteriota bacterium]|nr:hypothetical protein [Thermodesulfobacteriota bacterium]
MMSDIRSRTVNYRYLVTILLSVVFVNAFTVYYMKQERYIYNWDMLAYWDPYIEIGRSLLISPLGTIKNILLTVRYSDYNYLPVVPLLPFYYIFGETRLGYILAISNIYMLPSMLILLYLSDRVISAYRSNVDPLVFWLVFITILISMPLWIPTLRGYPDILGTILIGLILLIYLGTPLEKQNFILLLLTAGFLAIMSISRRYFNFWVEGFFVAAFLERSLNILLSGTRNYRAYLNLLINLFIIAIIFLVLDVLITGPMIKRQLTTHWSEIYGAYQEQSSWLGRCLEFPEHFGPLYSALVVIGMVLSVWTRRIRQFAVFLIIQTIVTVAAFTKVQSFDYHQYLMLCPGFLLFMAVFIDRSASSFQSLIPRIIFTVLYLIFIVTMFAYSLVPGFTMPKSVLFLYPKEQEEYKPQVRNDLEEINRLLEYIEDLAAEKPGSTFYLLSSSPLWNSSILQTAVKGKYKDPDTIPAINTTSDVDKRDGFPMKFFTSNYVIVAEPFQYHLDKNNQRIITIPAEKILKREGIGLNYRELPERFSLDKNIKLRIYERVKPPVYAAIRSTLNDFLAYYPEMAERYDVLPLELFVSGGDGAGGNVNVVFTPDNRVALKLDGDRPTEAVFSFGGDLKRMKITPSLGENCDSPAMVEIEMTGDGREIFRHAVGRDNAESYDVDLTGVDLLKLSAVSTGQQPCDSLNIEVVSQDWKTK